jgi:hypothetical protein
MGDVSSLRPIRLYLARQDLQERKHSPERKEQELKGKTEPTIRKGAGCLQRLRPGAKQLLALLVLLCASGCGASFRIHPTVVFVGDSITHEWSQSYNGQQATFAKTIGSTSASWG